KRTASEMTLKADPRYGSKLASKFINCLMWQGKKATAQRVFYHPLDQIKKRMPDPPPIEGFSPTLEPVKTTHEVRSKPGAGGTHASEQDAAAEPLDPVDHRCCPRQSRPAHVPAPGRRTDGRLPPRGRGHDQAREHHQDGRVQQGVRALRVVGNSPQRHKGHQ